MEKKENGMTYQDRIQNLSDFVRSGRPLGSYPSSIKGLRMTGYTQVLNGNSTLIQLSVRIRNHIGSEYWTTNGIDEYMHSFKCKGEQVQTDITDNLLHSLVRHLFFRAESGLESEASDLTILYRPCEKMVLQD
ncbi:MAG: hypothetical protein R6U40_06475, partial [Desulfobacterales bacterium]